MSGGSFGYMYNQIEEIYRDEFDDVDMNEMLHDFCTVLHDLEWWKSADYGEKQYRDSVKSFKKKWIRGYNNETNSRIETFKANLLKSVEEQLKKL